MRKVQRGCTDAEMFKMADRIRITDPASEGGSHNVYAGVADVAEASAAAIAWRAAANTDV